MTSIETRPSTNPRFVVTENLPKPNAVGRSLIRPGNSSNRMQAIEAFDSESTTSKRSRVAGITRPGIAELLVNAETLLKVGEKRPAAHLVRQALSLDSRHPETLRKMLRCLNENECDRKIRVSIIKTLVSVEPTFENFARAGQVLVDAGELDQALDAFFEASLRVQEESELLFEVHKNMGNIFVRRGDFDAAEEAYHKAFTLKPDSDILQVNLGTLAVQKEDWGSALARFRQCLEINPANDKGWVGVALCHHQVGDSLLALATLENALDLNGMNRTAVHLMANWSMPSGPVERAMVRLQDYLSTKESDVEMSLVLIHLFCHRQQYKWARLEMERALCWAPDRTDLLELNEKLQTPAFQEGL